MHYDFKIQKAREEIENLTRVEKMMEEVAQDHYNQPMLPLPIINFQVLKSIFEFTNLFTLNLVY